MMPIIRLIREQHRPTRSGPGRAQWALQRALRRAAIPWLRIGGVPGPREVPWVWSFEDKPLAVKCEIERRPFILGPNVFFANSRAPGTAHGERMLADAKYCRLMFTESQWYADLIERFRGSRNTAPLMDVPYPIYPLPSGPLPVEYDLLVYQKSGPSMTAVSDALFRLWPRSVVFRYGHHRRAELIAAARRSAVCLYLSEDDRGPLVLAEIMLAGCPAVGVPQGAPWIERYLSGVPVPALTDPLALAGAIEAARDHCSRRRVRGWALRTFAPDIVVGRLRHAMELTFAA